MKFKAVEVPDADGQNGSGPEHKQSIKQPRSPSPVGSKINFKPLSYPQQLFSSPPNGQGSNKRALPADLEEATRQISPKKLHSGHASVSSPEVSARQSNGEPPSLNGYQPGSRHSSHTHGILPPFHPPSMNGTPNQQITKQRLHGSTSHSIEPHTERSDQSVKSTIELGTPGSHPQGRLPSPILNRPRMTPTQGNVDVGPVAGVQNSAIIFKSEYPSSYRPSHLNGHSQLTPSQQSTPMQNGAQNMSGQPLNHMNPPVHNLSGISPTKHSPAISTPKSYLAQTYDPNTGPSSASRPQPASTGRRSISETQIFPPPSETQVLKPGPAQLNTSPVPTPSKPASPPTMNVHANAGMSVERKAT